MTVITPIHTPGTKQPVGHYSQAVAANGLVFVSGQVPADLETGTPRLGTIEEQTALALGNVGRILAAAGSGLEHAVQMTVFISNIDDWAAVNAAYARIMGAHRPTRAIVPVSPLHHGTAIEIQCVAVLPSRKAARPKAGRRVSARPARKTGPKRRRR
jgi:reactive intermediate/imine deaminase